MTNAEQIFRKTRRECKVFIERYGYEENVGLNRVAVEDDENITVKTLDEMNRLLRNARHTADNSKELGVMDDDRYTVETQVLDMIEATIANARKNIA